MTRKEVLDSLEANVEDQNLIRHMLATEAVMRSLARRLGEDEEDWGLTGLLHDIDVELTEEEPRSHSKLGADIAEDRLSISIGAVRVMKNGCGTLYDGRKIRSILANDEIRVTIHLGLGKKDCTVWTSDLT